jgi:arylsulfatase A-like enzyme
MPFFGPLDSLYSPDEVILPGSFDDVASDDDPISHRFKWEGNKKQYGNTEEEFRELIAKYWGLVTQVDMSVGAILDKLESLGLSENTIVVYTSDHGDMMGAHRMVTKGIMYEEAVRIPFLLKDARMNTSQRMIRQRVSQVDIVPTLLDLMGHEVPGYLEGKSLVPALKKDEFPAEDIFIEWNSHMDYRVRDWADKKITEADSVQLAANPSIRTVISKEGMKLSLSNRDKSQLFDLNNDPLEINNLFYEEEYQQTIKEMAGKIKEWRTVTNDTLHFPVN